MLCIYHANCYDGFCAAWIVHKKYPDAEFHAAHYNTDPPDVRDKDVLICDFSYPRDVLLKLRDEAKTLWVLDHHKTAQANCEGLDFCTFDMGKSGARLTWEHLFPGEGERSPFIVDYTEDRDLWRWDLLHSKEINAAIRSYPMDFDEWSNLEQRLSFGVQSVVTEGEAILRFQQQYIDMAKTCCREVDLSLHEAWGYGDVPIVNAPYFGISDLLNAICEERKEQGKTPIAVAWFQRKDGMYQYSLRSIGDIDVSAIARKYGGGGHKNAAGFESRFLIA
jgi:oligoribonuclease NrnB/cAMP/cGMP phosphodiesterase (DHH superfamily)